jgi:citrate lyase subunit beta/citryl-CoA lyase
MERSPAVSGNAGPKVRSDCEIKLEITSGGGYSIDLVSKVKALYGNSINDLVKEILKFFGIKNARIVIADSGALPFVISARLEAAIKQLMETELEFLPEFNAQNSYITTRDRPRYARLYLPGNNPSLMINAGLHSADGIILDLEDSVSPARKDEARILVRNALRRINFYGAERMVRINQGERGLKDLHSVIPHNVNLIIIPKCESADQVRVVENEIMDILGKYRIKNTVCLMPVIETALGIENAFSIATSSPDVVALAIGLEDYTADLGVNRTIEGKESFYARTRLVNASKAAGIQAIDSVFSDIGDMDALKDNVLSSRALGFEGMGCIHPRQIRIIRQGYSPDEKEIAKSKEIILAFGDAGRNGLGVIASGSKMIDAPVVEKAWRTVRQAVLLGLLDENWIEQNNKNL